MAETRKIAAILVSDVVGYSRLAGVDEDRTLARLRTLRSELVEPAVAAHNGRIVKSTGDGSLVEFRSVVDSVRCAVAVQKGMVERNVGVAPDRRIVFRIGIHLGDVVEESDGDLMGDGVNIAARLEGVAKPGAICLSEDAYRQVKARLDVAVTDLGPTQLKNIAEPMRAYSLEIGKPARVTRAPGPRRLGPIPWLAAALTLGTGVIFYAAAPQPAAPIASLASRAPLAQAPVEPAERVYPAPPVRETHKAAWTAPSSRPSRAAPMPAIVARDALASPGDAPYAYISPVERERAHQAVWTAPPARPDRPSATAPAAVANNAPAPFADAPYAYISPVERERAHPAALAAPTARPTPTADSNSAASADSSTSGDAGSRALHRSCTAPVDRDAAGQQRSCGAPAS